MIPQMSDVKKDAATVTTDTDKAKVMLDAQQVTDNPSMEAAVKWIAAVRDQKEAIDEKRKSWVKPLKAVIDDINATFKPAIDTLETVEADLKGKVSGYVTKALVYRDQCLDAVAKTDNPAQRQDLINLAEEVAIPKISGLSVRETWEGVVSDRDTLVQWCIDNGRLELLAVDEKALKALTKATGRDPKIPGWTATVKRTSVVTPSKVKR